MRCVSAQIASWRKFTIALIGRINLLYKYQKNTVNLFAFTRAYCLNVTRHNVFVVFIRQRF